MATRRVFGELVCKCERCGGVWLSRDGRLPAVCAKCKRAQWQRPPRPAPIGTGAETPYLESHDEGTPKQD